MQKAKYTKVILSFWFISTSHFAFASLWNGTIKLQKLS